jgi:hypothetical protein
MKTRCRPRTLVRWLAGFALSIASTGGLAVDVSVAQGTGTLPAQASAPSEEEALAVRQRAADYWAARVARDYRVQWDLSEPRLKGRITPEEYGTGKGAIQYLGYEVGNAKIDGSFATVQVKVIARVTLPKSQAKPVMRTATLGDAWVKVDGVWYRRADQPEASGRPPSALQ